MSKIKKLIVGQIGSLPIEIPYLIIGNGCPVGVILALQHGNEWSPLLVIKEILKQREKLKGTAIIVPVTNQSGVLFSSRNEAVEGKDLNRQFPGNPKGDFSGRLAHKIFSLCRKADFVIDLHSFSRQAPFSVGYCDPQSASVAKMITLLNPDIVWKINEKKGEDRRFQGSLNGALQVAGVASVFIEIPQYPLLKKEITERTIKGVIKVFSGFNKKDLLLKSFREYQAKYLYADEAGLFEPRVGVLALVKKGQTLGTICTLPQFKNSKISSPTAGKILTIKDKELVRTGTKLLSIGV